MANTYEDPNIDFDEEAAQIARELKQAELLKATKGPVVTDARYGGNQGFIGQQLSRAAGALNERGVLERSRALGQEETRRADALVNEAMTPGSRKVLTKSATYNPDAGYSVNEEEVAVPFTPEEENQRQMGIGQRMTRLPKTRDMGAQLVKSGVNFPEKMAEMNLKHDQRILEQGARLENSYREARAKAADAKELEALRNEYQQGQLRLAASLKDPNWTEVEADGEVRMFNPRTREVLPLGAATPKGGGAGGSGGSGKLPKGSTETAGRLVDEMARRIVLLRDSGDIPSEKAGTFTNLKASAANSPYGQIAERARGSSAQTHRDVIEASKIALLNEAKGLQDITGGQLNSNFELQAQLAAFGRNDASAEARLAALASVRKMIDEAEARRDAARMPQQNKVTPTAPATTTRPRALPRATAGAPIAPANDADPLGLLRK